MVAKMHKMLKISLFLSLFAAAGMVKQLSRNDSIKLQRQGAKQPGRKSARL